VFQGVRTLDLGDDEGLFADGLGGSAHRVDVGRDSTNDWLTASTPCFSANSRQARSWPVNALIPRLMPAD